MKYKRMLQLEGGVNMREMGGYPTSDGRVVKWQKLLRSGNMGQLTPKDLRFLDDYGLRYDVDLRSDSESEFYKDRYPKDATYINLSIYPFANNDLLSNLGIVASTKLKYAQLDIVDHTYAQMMADPHAQDQFRKLFSYLLENDKDKQSLVFHCAAGKDRTGAAAFLILSALGVQEKYILQDYLLTNLVFQNRSSAEINGLLTNSNRDELANELNSYLAVSGSNFKTLKRTCEAISGSMDKYLEQKMGLDADKRARLQEIYLETGRKNAMC